MFKFSLQSLLVTTLLSTAAVAQTCNVNILPTTPSDNFTVSNNGTVTDNKTGLIWMRCSLGQTWTGSECSGSPVAYTWKEALTEGKEQVFAGSSLWRLPNIKELGSIYEASCADPAVNETLFWEDSISQVYWSSTPNVNQVDGAWYIKFNDSLDNNFSFKKSNLFHVRLVRDEY